MSVAVSLMRLSTNVAKSTYFQFNNTICRQKEGLAVGGSPFDIIYIFFFLMEDLESKAINTPLTQFKPTVSEQCTENLLDFEPLIARTAHYFKVLT